VSLSFLFDPAERDDYVFRHLDPGRQGRQEVCQIGDLDTRSPVVAVKQQLQTLSRNVGS
jgi:hypothetical protein